MQELRSGPGVRVWACGPGIVFWDKCCVPLEEARGEGGATKAKQPTCGALLWAALPLVWTLILDGCCGECHVCVFVFCFD